ncbi:MAG: hypothetical protein LBL13_02225 [Bacteroidales bacterium]|nr:hypothetical protein [Bacteroidales bacterium]
MGKRNKGVKEIRQQAASNKQQAGKPRRAKARKGERKFGNNQQATSSRQASQEG